MTKPLRQPEGQLKDAGAAYLRAQPRTYVRHVQIGIIPGRRNASKGMFDTVVMQRGRVVWIEWKMPGEDLSDDQTEFYESCLRAGVEAYVIRSLEELMGLFPETETQLELLVRGRSIA